MKRVFVITGTFIVLGIVAGMMYLMHTEAGLQWLINRAAHSVSGLTITSAQGSLAGPMKVRGIRYTSGESFVSVDEIALDWKPSRLMRLEVHISSLKAEGINFVAAAQTAETEPAADMPEISVPLKIVLKKAVISNISILQNSEENPLHIQKVSFKGDMDSKAIRIDQLDMEMPELTLAAEGKISPRGDYPMRIATSWKARVPEYEEITGQGEIEGTIKLMRIKQDTTAPFYSSAGIKVTDIIENIRWEGTVSARDFNPVKLNRTWPDLPLSGTVSGRGSDMKADISALDIRILNGTVAGNGSVSWQPDISWSLNVNAAGLNPGIQWPEWQGELSVTAHTSGQYEKGALTVKPSEVFAEGRLRERRLKAQAKLSATDSQLELSSLEVSSGESRVSVSGTVSDAWSLKWKAQIRDAGDLVPKVKGAIEGSGSLSGSRSYPVIKGNISGRAVSYDNDGAESFKAVVDIDTKDERESLLDISAVNVVIGGQTITTVSVKSSGTGSVHSISMDAAMDRERAALLITGEYKDQTWTGKMNSAVIDTGTFGTWSLREPASLSVSADKAGSELLCLVRNASALCLQTSWDRDKGVKGTVSLTDIPLSMVKDIFPSSIEPEGNINGGGEILYTPEGMMSGNLSLIMPSGKLQYRMDDEPVDISLGKSRADIILDEKALDVQAEILFSDRGHINGGMNLPGFMPGRTAAADQLLTGHVAAELSNLDLIPVFVEKLHKTSGSVRAEFRIHGTLAETAITGDMTLQEGSADIPDLGLQLRDITLALKGDERGKITIEGRLSSGSGHAAVHGTAELHKEKSPSAVLRIQGADFEAVKIPGTWIIISPDIDVRIEDTMIDFAGSLTIPKARLEPPDVSDAVLPSKDVVITDMPVSKKEAGWSVRGKLKLSLGDDVRFSGYGLTCRITGGIDLTEQPGTVTQGQGEFQIVEGKYKAYGQDLSIEKGRLLFVGPVDDPGLDIRAFRKIKDVTTGVNIQGTLKTPTLHVYSVPSMDESDALSYLLFGRPMKQLSGSEGNTLYGAALSAGLSAGGFVAKKIGAAFGIEDIEVEKGKAPEQATLFIGKYLSPRLYLSYGIGLFEPVSTIRLRYDLTRRLKVQTEYGFESGGDIMYIIEH